MFSLTFCLKSTKVGDFLTDPGKSLHNRGAEEENDISYIAFFDLGTAREPFVVDFKVRL